MFGNYVVRPLSPVLSVPSSLTPFQNTQVNFYDPITLRTTGSIIPNQRVTQMYNSNGIVVELTGTEDNVKKAIGLLNIANNMPQSSSSATNITSTVQSPQLIGNVFGTATGPGTVSGTTSGTVSVNGQWSLVSNPANLSKFLLKSPNAPKPFSGSGVIIIEKNGTDPRVLLVKTARRGTYEDLGGEIDVSTASENTLKENAAKETLEESQNLFVLNHIDLERNVNGKMPYIDIDDIQNNALYRCYILVLDGTSNHDIPQFFAQNKLMTSNRMGYQRDDWRESIEMRRFSLQGMMSTLNSTTGGINTNDITNISCTIRDRTANCLRVLVNNKDFFRELYNNPVNVRYFYDRNFMSMTIAMHMFRV